LKEGESSKEWKKQSLFNNQVKKGERRGYAEGTMREGPMKGGKNAML